MQRTGPHHEVNADPNAPCEAIVVKWRGTYRRKSRPAEQKQPAQSTETFLFTLIGDSQELLIWFFLRPFPWTWPHRISV
jgi:hypothetical protein